MQQVWCYWCTSQHIYPRWLCRSAWVRFSSQSVCLFVRSITQNEWSQSVQSWYRESTWDTLEVVLFWGSKVKGQGRRVNKFILHIRTLCKGRRFSLLHHFQHPNKHRSRPVNQTNHENPFPTISTSSFLPNQMQIHFTHLTLFVTLLFILIGRHNHVETPIFYSEIWYLENAHSDRFQTFEKVCFSQC